MQLVYVVLGSLAMHAVLYFGGLEAGLWFMGALVTAVGFLAIREVIGLIGHYSKTTNNDNGRRV